MNKQEYKDYLEQEKEGLYVKFDFDSIYYHSIQYQLRETKHSISNDRLSIIANKDYADEIKDRINLMLRQIFQNPLIIDDLQLINKLGPDAFDNFNIREDEIREKVEEVFNVQVPDDIVFNVCRIEGTDSLVIYYNWYHRISDTHVIKIYELCMNSEQKCLSDVYYSFSSFLDLKGKTNIGLVVSVKDNMCIIGKRPHPYYIRHPEGEIEVIFKEAKYPEYRESINLGDLLTVTRRYFYFRSLGDTGVVEYLKDLGSALKYYGSKEKWIKEIDSKYDYIHSWSYENYEMTKKYGPRYTSSIKPEDLGIILKVNSISDSLIIAEIKHKKYPWLSPKVGDFVYK